LRCKLSEQAFRRTSASGFVWGQKSSHGNQDSML
jgi:hypothetical protein